MSPSDAIRRPLAALLDLLGQGPATSFRVVPAKAALMRVRAPRGIQSAWPSTRTGGCPRPPTRISALAECYDHG
jgi:hypothetical protein